MINLSFGTISILVIIGIYAIITATRNVFTHSKSLRDSEKIHRFLLIIGGLISGLGLGSVQENFNQIDLASNQFLLSIILTIAGFALMMLGVIYLKDSLWTPLENIAEYSAEFGTNFIATRLPETGGLELERFSHRFNQNAINLANKISKFEIKVDKIEENVTKTISTGKLLHESTVGLNDATLSFNSATKDQFDVVQEISAHVEEFVQWYDQTREDLLQNFIELRSLSEMGNLIAINAAVEASNLEIPNPTFDTLASRLRELARSLESRQETIRQVIDSVNNNYDLFRDQIKLYLSQAVNLSEKTNDAGAEIDSILQNINERNIDFTSSYERLSRSIEDLKENIPNSYS